MVVRMRHTRAHTANRRSHHALKESAIYRCPKCSVLTKLHQVCPSCGFYKGSERVDTMKKIQKKNKKKAKKEANS